MIYMKNMIKRIIPKRVMPVAKQLYLKLFDNSIKANYTEELSDKITALKCIVSYNKYGGYCVPESSRHRPAARKILSNDVYEPETIEFIMANCGSGDIVHAGTYFGDFLPALSRGSRPGSKIWAFEPNPENYRCAKITIEINNIGNVVLTNAGLGAKKEYLPMQTADKQGRSLGGASRILAKESEEATEAEAVQIVTIDDMVGSDRAVSIIQLDVEGHEKEALAGALRTIQRCLPVIIIEVLPNSTLIDSDWLSENILSFGYRKINDIHGNTVLSCKH
jgi:FkbM family methyltransferase